MPTLPASSDITSSTATEGDAKTWLAAVRAFIAAMVGTTGNQSDALAALGAALNSSVTKSGAYTVVAGDRGKVVRCTGTWTLSLAAVATLGDGFVFAVLNEGSGVITIDPDLSELIDGATTKPLAAGQMIIVYCDGGKFTSAGGMTFNGRSGAVTLQVSDVTGLAAPTAGTNYTPLTAPMTADSGAAAFVNTSTYPISLNGTSFAEAINFRILQAGTYRVSFSLRSAGSATAYGQIYKNGVAYGTQRSFTGTGGATYTEDLTFAAGDTLQVFLKSSSTLNASLVSQLKLGTAAPAVLPLFQPLINGDR